ncbi:MULTISPECIES: RNA polymerase sigma factor [unclassified Ekhidna]|jgi:RNA polymerase sigma factor (sigma-70 family)|uniref:RNA polymerase sigma factor n=1 Tax=unclassified Ekhidna TaxID=2632188 RepID=UPI0032DF96F3
MSVSEEKLIKGCQKGKKEFQQALYDKYCDGMYLVALRYSKMQQEAEDIIQEAFIKVFKNIKNFRKDSSLAYWIKRIVVNTALNHQRSKLYLYPMVDVNDLDDWSEKESAISELSYEELLDLIRELPTGCQVIFNLFAIEGYKHHEIAKKLKISEGTSKSQYSRAKSLLAEKIMQRDQVRYGSGEV